MTANQTIEKLSLEGLATCSSDDLHVISTELGLAEIAEKAARKVLPSTAVEELDQIKTGAPLRALDQASRNFVPNGKKYALSGYLKRFTWLWAKRYAEDLLKGKPADVTGQAASELPTSATEQLQAPQKIDFESLSAFGAFLEYPGFRVVSMAQNELSFRACCGDVEIQFFANAIPEAMVLFAYIPVFVPIYRRSAVAEALSRINWRVLFATFEMDFADGQIRVRGFVPTPGGVLNAEVAGRSLSSIRHEAGTFSKALIELALTDHDPETLVERAVAGNN